MKVLTHYTARKKIISLLFQAPQGCCQKGGDPINHPFFLPGFLFFPLFSWNSFESILILEDSKANQSDGKQHRSWSRGIFFAHVSVYQWLVACKVMHFHLDRPTVDVSQEFIPWYLCPGVDMTYSIPESCIVWWKFIDCSLSLFPFQRWCSHWLCVTDFMTKWCFLPGIPHHLTYHFVLQIE